LNNPVPAEPVFFLKPESSQLLNNRPFFYPDFSKEIHYEGPLSDWLLAHCLMCVVA